MISFWEFLKLIESSEPTDPLETEVDYDNKYYDDSVDNYVYNKDIKGVKTSFNKLGSKKGRNKKNQKLPRGMNIVSPKDIFSYEEPEISKPAKDISGLEWNKIELESGIKSIVSITNHYDNNYIRIHVKFDYHSNIKIIEKYEDLLSKYLESYIDSKLRTIIIKKEDEKIIVNSTKDYASYNSEAKDIVNKIYSMVNNILLKSLNLIDKRYGLIDVKAFSEYDAQFMLARVAGEVDWRPTETVPEDYYAL